MRRLQVHFCRRTDKEISKWIEVSTHNIGNRPAFLNGGFWTSSYLHSRNVCSWGRYLNKEGYHFFDGSRIYYLRVEETANVIDISTENDYLDLVRRFHWYNGLADCFVLDFEKLSRNYDGISFTERMAAKITVSNYAEHERFLDGIRVCGVALLGSECSIWFRNVFDSIHEGGIWNAKSV